MGTVCLHEYTLIIIQEGPIILILKSPEPTDLFLSLKEGKNHRIGSDPESSLILSHCPPFALNFDGLDRFTTENNDTRLNGTEVKRDSPSNLSHGDIIETCGYKLIYLDPEVDAKELAERQKANENSNTESCEEEIRCEIAKKSEIAKETRTKEVPSQEGVKPRNYFHITLGVV